MLRRELPPTAQKHAQISLPEEVQPDTVPGLPVVLDELQALPQSHPLRAQRVLFPPLGRSRIPACSRERIRCAAHSNQRKADNARTVHSGARSTRSHVRTRSARLYRRLQGQCL